MFYSSSVLLAVIAANGSAFAQSADRDHPTQFRSDEIRGELKGEEIEYFYSFTAGPGDVTLTLDVKSSDGTTSTAFELWDVDANNVLTCCEFAQADSTVRPGATLRALSLTICELLEWKRPNGRLKNNECRLLLEKLGAAGLLTLPPLRESGPRGPRVVISTERGAEQEPLSCSVGQLSPLTLTVVRSRSESALWNEFVQRYHYLGYRVPVGLILDT